MPKPADINGSSRGLYLQWEGKIIFIIFALIIVASVVVRFFRLGSRELWLDETYSALLANMPFKQMLQYIMGDVHPPLFYVLLWAWVRLAGDSEAALRLFSVGLFSIGTVGFFFVVRKWLGAHPAAFATSLFAVSPILFVYSLEVRMYMLLVCSVIALLGFHHIVTSETNRSWFLLILYGFAAALVYETHYVGLFVVGAFFLDWLILTRFRPNRLLRLGFAGLVTLALIAPWMPVMFHQRAQMLSETRALTTSYEDPTALTFHQVPTKLTFRRQLGASLYGGAVPMGVYLTRSVTVLMGLPVVLVLLGVLYLALTGDRVCRLFVIAGVSVFAGIVFLGLNEPRYFLPLLPLLFLAMARAIQVYERSRWSLVARAMGTFVLLIYVAGFIGQVTMVHPRPWSQLVASLAHNYQPQDVVIFDVIYGQVVFDYYARQAGFHPREFGFPESVYDWWGRQPFKGWGGAIVHKPDLDSATAMVETPPKPRTVWLVLYELKYRDPQDALRERLSRMRNTVGFEYPGVPLPSSSQGLDFWMWTSFGGLGNEFPRLVAIR
jgi:mannosyltransferase